MEEALSRIDSCRDHTAVCLQLAENTSNACDRLRLLKMAEDWKEIADCLEQLLGVSDRPPPWIIRRRITGEQLN
jgi:hypothetical protein